MDTNLKFASKIRFYMLIWRTDEYEPTRKISALIALRKLNLPTRMRSNPLGLHVWYLVRTFVSFHTLCVWTMKALARGGCTVSPEPSLFACAISTIISWAGSNYLLIFIKYPPYLCHWLYRISGFGVAQKWTVRTHFISSQLFLITRLFI